MRSSGFINPCKIGNPAKTLDGSVQACSATADEHHSMCPTGYYCHVGEQKGTCCEKTSSKNTVFIITIFVFRHRQMSSSRSFGSRSI